MSGHDNIKVRVKGIHQTKGKAVTVTWTRDDGVATWTNLPTSQILQYGKAFVVIPKWLADKERLTRRSIDNE